MRQTIKLVVRPTKFHQLFCTCRKGIIFRSIKMKFSVPSCTMPLDGNCCASLIVNGKRSDGMNHDNHSCMIREMFPERVKHLQSIVDMSPRKAVPVLSLRNARVKSVVSIEHKTTTIHRTTTGSKYKMQWSSRNVPYSNVFKTYSVEYASDPRFKIQGAGQSSPWHLES